MNEVSKLTNIPKSTIKRFLDEAKIKKETKYKSPYDNDIKKHAIELYASGYNSVEISSMLNVASTSVMNWLHEKDKNVSHRGPLSKIKIENFFDNIDTEAKAYYLGFIMADGNISNYNNQYSLKIHISYKDKEIIDDFLKEIKSTNKTKKKSTYNKIYNKSYESYYVSLTSVHMVKTLLNNGLSFDKSGNELIPSTVPDNLMHHFIRGYFDGDGITDIKKNRSGFVGSYEILNNIMTITQINKVNLIARCSCDMEIYYFICAKKDSKKLFNFLYKDATIYLKRKKDRMNIICGNTEVTY